MYVLGEKLQDAKAKDTAIDAILALAVESRHGSEELMIPGRSIVTIIYDGTLGDCSARCLLVDLYTFRGTGLNEENGPFPVDFVTDLVKALLAARPRPMDLTKTRDPNYYHEQVVKVED